MNKEHPTAEVEAVDSLVERMRTQLFVWEDNEPREGWWNYQCEYAEAFKIIEALSTKESDLRAENERLREEFMVFVKEVDSVSGKVARVHIRRARAALQGSAS